MIGPYALISWLNNLHRARTRPHWKEKCFVTNIIVLSHVQHKTTKTTSFRNKFWSLKTYHPVLDERRLKETVLRIWNLAIGQMYRWMRCIIFLYLSLPERMTILRVLKMCKDNQRNHFHKTLTILISTV